MTKGGLVLAGLIIPVEGMRIESFVDNPKLQLSGRDYKARKTKWPRQWVIHTTKGVWPQFLVDGIGPPLAADGVVKFWNEDPLHSGAQLVVDGDSAVQTCDIATCAASHATTANDWSTGVEMYQERDGVIRKATIANTVRLVIAGMKAQRLPLQIASDRYVPGKIIERLKYGGPDFVGIYGHRDQAWKFPEWLDADERRRFPNGYAARGRGDPGDGVYDAFIATGEVEAVNVGAQQDRALWRGRQLALNRMGEDLDVDGIPGRATMDALERRGFSSGPDLDAHVDRVLYFCPCGRSSAIKSTPATCSICGGAMAHRYPPADG